MSNTLYPSTELSRRDEPEPMSRRDVDRRRERARQSSEQRCLRATIARQDRVSHLLCSGAGPHPRAYALRRPRCARGLAVSSFFTETSGPPCLSPSPYPPSRSSRLRVRPSAAFGVIFFCSALRPHPQRYALRLPHCVCKSSSLQWRGAPPPHLRASPPSLRSGARGVNFFSRRLRARLVSVHLPIPFAIFASSREAFVPFARDLFAIFARPFRYH
jgi:hypothetical protein